MQQNNTHQTELHYRCQQRTYVVIHVCADRLRLVSDGQEQVAASSPRWWRLGEVCQGRRGDCSGWGTTV